MSSSCSNISSSYDPSSIVSAFHNVPHINIDLREVSSDFSVSLSYFEPVIIWGCVPILACLCIFILLLVYFIFICCCCCCCRDKTYRPRTCKLSCAFIMSLMFIFCLGLVGVLFYAEVSLDRNVKSFITSGGSIVNEVSQVSASVDRYNSSLVTESMNFVKTQISNSTGDGKDAVLESVNLILDVNDDINAALNNINDGLESVQYDSVIKDVDNFETIRTWSMIGIFILVGVLLIISCLVTVCMTSVGITIMLVFLSIITLLIWILTGGVLASTIVLSDICINPDGLIRNNTNNDPIAKEFVNYFISCEPACRPTDINETDTGLQKYQAVVDNVTYYIRQHALTANDSFNIVKNEFAIADQVYNNVSSILNCNPSQGIKEHYNSILDSMCDKGQLFLVILLSVLAGLSLSLFLLVCCLTGYDGLLINTSSDEDFDQDDIVAFDTERGNSWGSSPRRLSYVEPYANGRNRASSNASNDRTEHIRMSEATPPQYTVVGRPTSGEYDHFDV